MRTLVNTTLAVFLLAFVAGCDTILEKPSPSTQLRQDRVLSNENAIDALRAGMYDRFHQTATVGTGGTTLLVGPSALADNTIHRPKAGRGSGLNFFQNRAGLGTGHWNELYAMINDANLLIKGIKEGALPQAKRQKYKAEGLVIRAFAHWHLVRIFGYDPAGPNPEDGLVQPKSGPGANWNKGVVIRTKPTLAPEDAKDKARATVREVYDQVLSDLNQAISLFSGLPSDVKSDSRYFATEAAAQAILARVQLYQRGWEAANTAAQNAIDLAASRFGSSLAEPSQLEAIFDETTGDNPEAIWDIETAPQAAVDPINTSPSVYTSIGFTAQVPTQEMLDLYESSDKRKELWYGPCIAEDEGENHVEGCKERNNKGWEVQKYQSERGVSLYADDYPMTRIAEMVLIQAEARLKMQGGGVAAAINRLNDLRAKRNASMLDPANYDQKSAMNEILAERRRELIVEGHRFFDLKRLGRDIPKDHVAQVPYDRVEFNSHKILDNLPTGAIDVNDKLTQNPGY